MVSPQGSTALIHATGLTKKYGDVEALAGLDLSVPEGTVLGLLGPNGAGKTTAVRILTTLITDFGGDATIAGVDVRNDPDGVRRRIGLSGQYAAVDEYLTGYENLEMVGRLYGMKQKDARARARELLERFGLSDAADRPSKTYSGGMRRRLDLAGALVAEPPVIVLDEPTTGLDPRSRQQMWEVIEDLVDAGRTVLLTTQYLAEADLLADNIIVIDHGRAIAEGTADQLKSQVGGDRIEVVLADPIHADTVAGYLTEVAKGDVNRDDRSLSAAVRGDGAGDLMHVLGQINDANIEVLDIGLRRPTLDDVFLTLTGHEADDQNEETAR